MAEPLDAMREEWAQLVWDFLDRVSHNLRAPSDLADEAEELRRAMEKLGFWEMDSGILDRADRWEVHRAGEEARDKEGG